MTVKISAPQGKEGYTFQTVTGAYCQRCDDSGPHILECGYLACARCTYVNNLDETRAALRGERPCRANARGR